MAVSIPKKLLDVLRRRSLLFVLFVAILVILLFVFSTSDTKYSSEK